MKNKKAKKMPDAAFHAIEYQKAQDSAQHHTNLGWTVSSIIFAGSLGLLGFVSDKIMDPRYAEITVISALLGMALSVTMNLADKRFGEIARQKYQRCKELEQILGGRQHLDMRSYNPSIRTLVNMVTMALALTWAAVLLIVVYELGIAQ